MYQPPPVPEPRQRPEDAIPDEPQNQEVREFLKNAPTEGLWMPLGKEVKVMQCWRCKAYGHRAGDKECQLFQVGSEKAREFAQIHEDPMASYVKHDAVVERQRVKEEKLARVAYLHQLLVEEEEKQRKHKEKRKKHRRSSSSSRSDSPKRKKHKNK
jgi:retinitis pigmentosa 9 protein